MANGFRTGDPRGFNKGHSSKLKKAGGHVDRNVVEVTINIKTIVRKPLMIKILLKIQLNISHLFTHS